MKAKMTAPGKFKMKNRRQSNSVLSYTEILFLCFPTRFEIRSYFQQFTVNLFREWSFLLRPNKIIVNKNTLKHGWFAVSAHQHRAKK